MNSENTANVVGQLNSSFELNETTEVIRILHKVTIDNFGDYLEDEFWADALYEGKSYRTEQFGSYLELSVNKCDQGPNGNLVVFVNFELLEKVECKVKYKLTILDYNGKCRFEKEVCKEVEKMKYVWIYYVESDCLRKIDKLKKSDEMYVRCEMTIATKNNETTNLNNKEMRNKDILKIDDGANGNICGVEDILKANPRVLDSLAHKWTIDNFRYFYNDEWPIEKIESDEFYSSLNKEHKFQLILYPNGDGDDCRNNLSIYLNHFSFENLDVNVQWKISIIDENGKKLNTRVRCNVFCGEKDNWGINCGKEDFWGHKEYISVTQLLEQNNGLLHDGQLRLYCELEILDNQTQNPIFESIDPVRQSILELNQSSDSVLLCKCAHKWTIHNFACALAEESSGDELISSTFSSPSKSQDYTFHLSVFPDGYIEENRKYVVSLHVHLSNRMPLTFRHRTLQIDANGNKLKLHDGEWNMLHVDCSISINESISHNELHQQLLNGTLTLYCEIEAVLNETDLRKNKIYEYFHTLSKLKLNDNEVTETVTNAKAKKIHVEHTWDIENCVEKKDSDSQNSLFTSQPTSSYIESPPFSPPNHSITNLHRFFLRMYPNGVKEANNDYVSIFLFVETFQKRQVTCEFKLSLIDNLGFKINTEECKYRFNDKNNVLGWPKFISHSDLFNSVNALITDNKLRVHCEGEFLDEENIVTQNKPIEITQESNICNLEISKIPTQTITQVTLHTHHWTIDNFGLYFQSIQDESSYLESIKFSSLSDNQDQFIVRLYSKRVIYFSMYFDLICNRKQSPSAQVQISILDENSQKWYTKTFTKAYWKIKYDIYRVLDLNSISQFKLLIQYSLCTHYSSPTEMAHLDQFSLDHFTSPWQVKRLCDVPTHSRALTSIPVESGHFDWSIPDFSSQQESAQSANFSFSENNQLQFFLRMNLHSQDKISINLCLKKSVDRETRILVQIAIMDKDGHKFFTADGFVKLFEGELEYECVKPFENGYFSANGLLQDDTLRMSCEFKLVGDATCTEQVVESIPKVLPQLNSLLTNCQKTDFMFHFGNDNKLHAHRSILSARSPVFKKMYQHDTLEAQLGQVDITDVDMEVCELMLRYIYTGLVNLNQKWTLDLMIAADKYELTELKDQCEDWLCTNLSIESVTDCLVWSDQIGATKLKSKSIEFFHRNLNKISQEKTFKELVQKRPELLLELYLNLSNQFNNQIESNVIGEEGDISVL